MESRGLINLIVLFTLAVKDLEAIFCLSLYERRSVPMSYYCHLKYIMALEAHLIGLTAFASRRCCYQLSNLSTRL